MKQLIFLILVSLHLTAIAQSPEIGDSTALNSSAPNRHRVFFGGPNKDELFGRTNTGAIKRYAPVRSVNGKIGSVTLLKADFPFLSNVDNTADISKPISTAQLTALNRKPENMTLAQLRASTNLSPPETVFLLGTDLYGFFQLQPGNFTTPDDNGMNWVVTAAGQRYKRVGLVSPTGSIPIANLAQSGATFGQVPMWNGSVYVPTTISGGGGSGTVNSASNANTAGVGIYQGLVGSDLQFKGIQAGSNRVSVVDNTNNKTVTVDVNTANLTLPASQISGLSPVATSNSYADLTGKPVLGAVALSNSYNDLTNKPALGAVATSNSYTDLSNKPTLGTASTLDVAASGNAASTQVVRGNDTRLTDARTPTAHLHPIADVTGLQTALDAKAPLNSPSFTGTPTAPTPGIADNSTNLATTAWVRAQNYGSGTGGEVNTGSNVNTLGVGVYKSKVGADLQFKGVRAASNRVAITDNTGNNTVDVDVNTANLSLPATQITGLAPVATSGVYNDLTGKPTLSTVATSGAYNDLTGKPTLSTVATTGTYNDLSGKPTLGTSTALNVPATGNAATGEVVKGDDSRLTNSRTPTAHTHAISEVTNLQTTLDGKAPLASPTFTGTPIVPSPAANDNSTQATNTAWVRTWVQSQGYASGTGVGETNTGSNVNSTGVGVFQGKTGTNLEFRGIAPASTKLSVTSNTTNKTVDLDVNEANLTLTQSQVTGLVSSLAGKENTITAGSASQVILGNKTLGTLAPALVGLGNVSNSLQVINAGGTVSMGSGTLAARPAAGTVGRFYYATDNNTEYYDNGTAWVVRQSAITGDVTISAGGTTSTLPTVNANVGTFGTASQVPTLTVNGKGQVTGVTSTAITPAAIGAEPAITAGTTAQVLLGNKTLGTLNPALVGLANVPNVDATNASNLATGTLPAARFPAFSGEVVTAPGSLVNAIGSNVVTNAKLAQVATGTLKGRATAGTGNAEDLTVAQARVLLGVDQLPNLNTANAANINAGTLDVARTPAYSGDATKAAGSASIVLNTVNANVGAVGAANQVPVLSLDAKGRVLSASTATITPSGIGAEAATNKTTSLASPDNTKFPTTQAVANALSTKPETMALATLRANNEATPPGTVELADVGRGATYQLDNGDTTTPDNGGTVLVTGAGKRYKLQLADRRLTPYHFGAKGDSLTDDGAALQAWLNQTGWELVWPAGKFRTSIRLDRINRRNVTITGAGISQTKIYFSGDTDGLRITNDSTALGQVVLRGFALYSVSAKTNRTALLVTTQDEARPGPFIENILTESRANVAHEWTVHYHLRDCSHATLTNIDAQGGSYNTATGIMISSRPGKPATEININNVQGRTLKRLVDITCTAYPAIEGVAFNNVFGVGVKEGIVASSTAYNTPQLTFNNVHINSFGGRCIDLRGYGQLSFKSCLFYANAFGGVTPDRAVYIDSPIFCSGDFLVNTLAASPYAVEFAGNGGGVNMDLNFITNHGSTNAILVGNGFAGSPPQFGMEFIWTGANGPSTAQGIVGPGRQKFYAAPSAIFSANGNTLQYIAATGRWEAVNRIQGTRLHDGIFVSSSQTIDPAQFNMIRLAPGAANIVVTLDVTKLTQAQTITFNRVNETHTGTITLTTSNSTANKFQLVDGSASAAYVLPKSKGARYATFYFDGANLQLISGGIGLDDNSGTSETDAWSAFKSTTETINSRNRANHTGFNPLSSLSQSGATTNQVPQWNGTAWVPATVSGSSTTDASLLTTGTLAPARLPTSGVTAGSYTNASITLDATGRATAASSGPAPVLATEKNAANGVATLDANTKIPFAQLPGGAINDQSGTTYTFVASDCNKTVRFTNSGAITATIPANAVTAGCSINWAQKGTGVITFANGASMTFSSFSGFTKSAGQHAMGTILFDTSTTSTLGGNISN